MLCKGSTRCKEVRISTFLLSTMINIIILSDNQNIKSRDQFIMNLYRKTCFPYSYTADSFLSGFHGVNNRENCSHVLRDIYQKVKRSTVCLC